MCALSPFHSRVNPPTYLSDVSLNMYTYFDKRGSSWWWVLWIGTIIYSYVINKLKHLVFINSRLIWPTGWWKKPIFYSDLPLQIKDPLTNMKLFGNVCSVRCLVWHVEAFQLQRIFWGLYEVQFLYTSLIISLCPLVVNSSWVQTNMNVWWEQSKASKTCIQLLWPIYQYWE